MADSKNIKLEQNIENIIKAISLGRELNPPNNLNSPCSVCAKNVLSNQKAVCCDTCMKWCHIKCDGTSVGEYDFLISTDDSIRWDCLACKLNFQYENVPFTLCDLSEIIKINNSDSMKFCNFLPSLDIMSQSNEMANTAVNDIDNNLPTLTNCKYYSVKDYQKMKVENNFNIFHSNVNGLESKMDSLLEFIVGSSSFPDVVAITETSQQTDKFFISNVSMDG